MVDLGSATAYLLLDTSNFDRGLSTAAKELNGFNKEGASAEDKLKSVGNSMQAVGKTMTKSVTLPLVAAGTAIFKTSSDFESGMANVKQLSGATGDEFDQLSKKAREMGASTEFSATEASEALGYMALAGWDTTDMMAGLSSVMDLSTVSGEALGSTSDILTDAITAFGHTAHDQTGYVDEFGNSVNYAQHFADILATTSAKSNTTVGMLGEAFKYCAPAAGALGYEAEDVALALGLMANNGIKASQGGTALRRLLLNMIKPSSDAAAVMDEYNLSLFNADGSAKDFGQVLGELRNTFRGTGQMTQDQVSQLAMLDEQFQNGQITEDEYNESAKQLIDTFGILSDSELSNAAASLVGATGLSGFLAIVNSSDEDFNKLQQNIENCNGSVTEMAGVMRETSEVQLKILVSALQELAISLGETLVPIIIDVVKQITEWINAFNNLDPSVKEIIVKVGLFLATVGPVVSVVGNIVSLCGTVAGWIGSIIGLFTGGGGLLSALGSLGSAIGGIFSSIFSFVAANPVVLAITAAIAAVIWLVSVIVENWDAVKEATAALWEGIKSIFGAVIDFFKGVFEGAKAVIVAIWESLVAVFSAVWEGIKAIFSGVVEFFSTLFGAAKDAIVAIWETIVEVFSGIWEAIKAVFEGVVEFFSTIFQSAWDAIVAIWETIVEVFAGIWEAIKAVFESVIEFFTGVFQGAWDAVTSIWESLVDVFSSVWETIKGIFGTVVEFFSNIFQGAKDAIVNAWSTVVNVFSGIWDGIKNIFSNVGEFFWDVGTAIVDAIWGGIKSVWNTMTGWISDGISSVLGWLGIGGSSNGSYANGLDYVQKDGLYYLHEGESVKTKEETARGSHSSGDVYNFYSPKALDEVTAAREMRRTKQQMALGFD